MNKHNTRKYDLFGSGMGDYNEKMKSLTTISKSKRKRGVRSCPPCNFVVVQQLIWTGEMGLPVPTINTNAYKIKIRQKLTTYKPQIHKPMTYSINNSKTHQSFHTNFQTQSIISCLILVTKRPTRLTDYNIHRVHMDYIAITHQKPRQI